VTGPPEHKAACLSDGIRGDGGTSAMRSAPSETVTPPRFGEGQGERSPRTGACKFRHEYRWEMEESLETKKPLRRPEGLRRTIQGFSRRSDLEGADGGLDLLSQGALLGERLAERAEETPGQAARRHLLEGLLADLRDELRGRLRDLP
jgi:hypothetical protein